MSAYTELASQVQILKDRGWKERNEVWYHPKRIHGGNLLLFTFDQVLKIEGIE